jgi:hypothetical protein
MLLGIALLCVAGGLAMLFYEISQLKKEVRGLRYRADDIERRHDKLRGVFADRKALRKASKMFDLPRQK